MTLYTHGGEAWATMGYPLSIHRVNVMLVVAALAHVQGRFRDTFPGWILEILGAACESSQRAALVGDTLIRTAGIVELSVS